MRIPRRALAAAGAVVALAGFFLARGGPRFVWMNTGLRLDYPWPQGAALIGSAAGLALLAAAAPRVSMKIAAGVATLGVSLSAMDRLSYRVEADERTVLSRAWLREAAVPWAEVTRVESGPAVVVVWGRDDAPVRIQTGGLNSAERAMLERAIARRVQHGSAGETDSAH
jgi:hypothetical protein